jgi:hypothetical protein
MAGPYGDEINARTEFFALLDVAIATTADMLVQSPGSPVAQSAAKQLAAIKLWTAEGRTPTEEERFRINIGIMAAREFDDTRLDWSSPLGVWVQRLSAINNYTDGWPSDEVAANPPANESLRNTLWRQRMLEASRE